MYTLEKNLRLVNKFNGNSECDISVHYLLYLVNAIYNHSKCVAYIQPYNLVSCIFVLLHQLNNELPSKVVVNTHLF